MAYSECLPTLWNPLAEKTCCSAGAALYRWAKRSYLTKRSADRRLPALPLTLINRSSCQPKLEAEGAAGRGR